MRLRRGTVKHDACKLPEADRLLEGAVLLLQVEGHGEVTEPMCFTWPSQYGGTRAEDAKQMIDLERENAPLNRLVADQTLDIEIRKRVVRATSGARLAAGLQSNTFA